MYITNSKKSHFAFNFGDDFTPESIGQVKSCYATVIGCPLSSNGWNFWEEHSPFTWPDAIDTVFLITEVLNHLLWILCANSVRKPVKRKWIKKRIPTLSNFWKKKNPYPFIQPFPFSCSLKLGRRKLVEGAWDKRSDFDHLLRI